MRALVVIVTVGVLALAGCGSDGPGPGGEPSGTGTSGGSGDYAFGTERDDLATAVTAAFASSNGAAHWEGDTLVLSVDGDADETLAGFTQCSVLSHLLAEGDASVIEFPNGRIDCATVRP